MSNSGIFIVTGTSTIGRKTFNDIALLNDLHTSNQHCRIELNEGSYFLEDLDSTNGTWVRLDPTRPAIPLKLNNCLKIGNEMIFSVVEISDLKTPILDSNLYNPNNNSEGLFTFCVIC